MSVPTRRLLTTDGVDAMGEVKTTPTQFTLLRRLKDVGISVDAVTTAVGNIKTSSVITTPLAIEVDIGTGNTSEAALAANASRVYALFVNNSDTKMYLRLGETSVDNEGIPLAANGGFYEIIATNLYKGLVNVICASSGKRILVTEGV